MQAVKNDSDRRADDRIELPLQITLYGQDGKALNISATGVYFEIINVTSSGNEIGVAVRFKENLDILDVSVC